MTGLQIKIIIMAVFYAILLGIVAFEISKSVSRPRRETEETVKRLVGSTVGSEAVLQKKKKGISLSKLGTTTIDSNGFKEKKTLVGAIADALADELFASDVMMKPEEFVTVWLVITFIPACLCLLFINNIFVPIVLAVAGAASPFAYMKIKKKKRTQQFEEQLGDALLLMSSSLRSGLSLQQAMATISRDMYPPISHEFARACNEINMGFTIDDALEHIIKRIDSADFKIVSVAISVQRTTGGNLSDILSTISTTIKERAALKKEIKSITASGRLTGGVIGCMPIAILILLNMFSPGYYDDMLKSTGGMVALGVGAGLEILGFIVINKITTVKY